MTKQQRAEANKATADSAEQGIAVALQESYAASVEGDLIHDDLTIHNITFACSYHLATALPRTCGGSEASG